MLNFTDRVIGRKRDSRRRNADLYAQWVEAILRGLEEGHGLEAADFRPERLNRLLEEAFETGKAYSRDIGVPMKTIVQDVIPPNAMITTIIRQVIDEPESILREAALEKGFDLQAQPRHLTEILQFEPRITK